MGSEIFCCYVHTCWQKKSNFHPIFWEMSETVLFEWVVTQRAIACMSNSSKSPLSRKSSERTLRLRRKQRFVYLRKAQPFYFGEEDHSISVKARVWQCAIYFARILFNSLSFKNRYFFFWLCDSHIKKNKGSLFW